MPGAALRGLGRAYLKNGGSPAWTRKEGKKMMKEGQKIRKGMKDTGKAFQFRSKTSYHAINPEGDAKKFKIKKGIAGGD